MLLEVASVGFIEIDQHWEKVSKSRLHIYFYIKLYLLIFVALLLFTWFFYIVQDLPYDPTGELEKLKLFVEENADICMLLGIALLTVQVYHPLLTIIS